MVVASSRDEAIVGDGAIDVDDMAGGTIHGGNGRLPVSRPEHVNHLEGGEVATAWTPLCGAVLAESQPNWERGGREK